MSSLSVPFTVFDYFSYLIAGFILLLSADYSLWGLSHAVAFETSAQKDPPGWVWLLLYLIIAYVLGHALAAFASSVVQNQLVNRWPGKPSHYLLPAVPKKKEEQEQEPHRFWKTYRAPLEPHVQHAIRTAASKAIGTEAAVTDGDTVFNICEAAVRKDPDSYAFIDRCASLFSFCRNLSLALFLSAALFGVGWHRNTVALNLEEQQQPLINMYWLIAAALVGGAVLFFRYLKFYRLHAATVFYSFALTAESEDDGSNETSEQSIKADVALSFGRRE